MRVEESEGSGLRHGRTPGEGRMARRCPQLMWMACAAERLNSIDRQEHGAGQCKRSCQPGTVTQGLSHAQDPRGNQRPVCYRAEQHDGSDMLAAQALAKDEGILGTDGNDETQAQGQTLGEGRKRE